MLGWGQGAIRGLNGNEEKNTIKIKSPKSKKTKTKTKYRFISRIILLQTQEKNENIGK